VTVVPADTPAKEVLALNPDGVFLSNGPGDPEGLPYAVEAVRALLDSNIPILGICLGHQLLGMAMGGRKRRLKFGHHGGNHPVQHLPSGKVLITAQNHNYFIETDSLDPAKVEITYLSLNDNSLEGLRLKGRPVSSVQFHPEAAPGPHDAHAIFGEFFENIRNYQAWLISIAGPKIGTKCRAGSNEPMPWRLPSGNRWRFPGTMTALEYGCGTGLLSFALQAELGAITLADSSSGMLEVLREKIARGGSTNMTPLRLDLAIDPLPVERFDLVYTLMTLHHIPDTAKILGCFHSLLQPGGVLCIADLDKEDGSFHSHEARISTDIMVLTARSWDMELERAGFTNIRFSTCYELIKDERSYPLFLAVAEKK
jgi:anthranilate/para-aminobenzoate synthase component II